MKLIYGNYYITEFGNVFNTKSNTVLTWCDNGNGYKYVAIKVDGKMKNKTIHRLVAETFIPNPNNLPQVNHKDGNKNNNHVSNLEWITARDNNQHAIDKGLRNTIHVNMYSLNGQFLNTFNSIRDANRYLGLKEDCTGIYECLFDRVAYKNPIFKGYRWEYLNGGNNGQYNNCK